MNHFFGLNERSLPFEASFARARGGGLMRLANRKPAILCCIGLAVFLLNLFLVSHARAGGMQTLSTVIVNASAEDLAGDNANADDSVKAKAMTLLEAKAGYKFTKHLQVVLQGFNLLNAQADDIEYYYASRLQTEPLSESIPYGGTGTNDIHFKPIEPINGRLTLIYYF